MNPREIDARWWMMYNKKKCMYVVRPHSRNTLALSLAGVLTHWPWEKWLQWTCGYSDMYGTTWNFLRPIYIYALPCHFSCINYEFTHGTIGISLNLLAKMTSLFHKKKYFISHIFYWCGCLFVWSEFIHRDSTQIQMELPKNLTFVSLTFSMITTSWLNQQSCIL